MDFGRGCAPRIPRRRTSNTTSISAGDLIQKVKEQQANLAAKMQRLKARKSQEARKRDTRRKILMGAMLEDRLERGELPEQVFKADMDRFLVRARDRELFGLPPRSASTADTEGEQHR